MVEGRGGLALAPRANAVFLYTIMLLLALFALFPIAWMVTSSIRPDAEIFLQPARWLPPTPTLEAYVRVFNTPGTCATS